jgi:hypothetical protein
LLPGPEEARRGPVSAEDWTSQSSDGKECGYGNEDGQDGPDPPRNLHERGSGCSCSYTHGNTDYQERKRRQQETAPR